MLKLSALEDRLKGMFYGLAIGDALGCPVEFLARDTFPAVTGYRTGTHRKPPGTFTDDTSMAIALAHSLKNGFDLHDQLSHYSAWRKGDRKYGMHGCFDIGGTTSSSISFWEQSRALRTTGSEYSLGNGSIMRAGAIIAYATRRDASLNRVADLCSLSSVTTHPHPRCIYACRLLGVLCAMFAGGADPSEVLTGIKYESDVFDAVFPNPSHADPEIWELWQEKTFLSKSRGQIDSSGYALSTLEAALWSFVQGKYDFEKSVLIACNLGFDSDTTGAVCGTLAGAHCGLSRIPAHLIDGLEGKSLIEDAASWLWS